MYTLILTIYLAAYTMVEMDSVPGFKDSMSCTIAKEQWIAAHEVRIKEPVKLIAVCVRSE